MNVTSTVRRPFRVLSLDGGGMGGTHTATYLACLAATFARRRHLPGLDVGAALDLTAGTSTGGISACALALDGQPTSAPPVAAARLKETDDSSGAEAVLREDILET